MMRKPEWMIMYQELLEQHRLQQASSVDHPHEIRVRCSWESSFDDEVAWCLENLDMDSWRWGYILNNDGDDGFQDGIPDHVLIFAFADDADRPCPCA